MSVIICTRNRFEDFKKTLPSIMMQTRLPDELIVVDSSDTQRIETYLDSISFPFPVRYFHTQPGLTLQRNHGIRESTGDLIFFFDDDVELDANYLAEAEKVFASDMNRKIGAVGGQVVNPYGNQMLTFRLRFELVVFGFFRCFFGLVGSGNGRFRFSGMPTHLPVLEYSKYFECLSGCCMAFRREVFEKAAFDESLALYGLMEDVDISKQTLDAGYKICYQATARLVHNESPTNRLDRQRWAEMTVTNYNYLFRKNWARDWFRWPFYYWALLGLIVINLHNRDALRGTLSGIKKLRQG
ncbi:MAG: glycosyltransferase family 2 protein [Anaerolineales bacterium]|nr:glycosyltransferase family 2 protein [Anaerolineales bacterium]